MRDLKDTVRIENLCTESKAPVFVTKNGYGKLVIMDLETFERLIESAYEAKKVNEGVADDEAGRVSDGLTVLENIKKKYGF